MRAFARLQLRAVRCGLSQVLLKQLGQLFNSRLERSLFDAIRWLRVFWKSLFDDSVKFLGRCDLSNQATEVA